MKQCYYCKEYVPLAMFGKHEGRSDGLQGICKPCDALRQRQYRKGLKAEPRRNYVDEYSRRLQMADNRAAANLSRKGGSKTLRSVMMELLGVRDV